MQPIDTKQQVSEDNTLTSPNLLAQTIPGQSQITETPIQIASPVPSNSKKKVILGLLVTSVVQSLAFWLVLWTGVLGLAGPLGAGLVALIIGILSFRKLISHDWRVVIPTVIPPTVLVFANFNYQNLPALILPSTLESSNFWIIGLLISVLILFLSLSFHFFLTKLSMRAHWVLAATVALTLSLGYHFYIPTFMQKRNFQEYAKENDAILAVTDIELYAPKHATGKFVYEQYVFNELNQPPVVELYFTNGIKINVFKRPANFNPSTDCGPATPYGANASNIECVLAATSPRDRKIYSYIQIATLRFKPEARPEGFFVDLGQTVISLDNFQREATLEDAVKIIDALEPVSFDELKSLTAAAKKSE